MQGNDNGPTDGHGKMVDSVALEELGAGQGSGGSLLSGNLDVIRKLRLRLEVAVGHTEISVGELLDLKVGSVLELDRDVDAPLDVVLDGRVVARGSLVVVDDHFGIHITEIGPEK